MNVTTLVDCPDLCLSSSFFLISPVTLPCLPFSWFPLLLWLHWRQLPKLMMPLLCFEENTACRQGSATAYCCMSGTSMKAITCRYNTCFMELTSCLTTVPALSCCLQNKLTSELTFRDHALLSFPRHDLLSQFPTFVTLLKHYLCFSLWTCYITNITPIFVWCRPGKRK